MMVPFGSPIGAVEVQVLDADEALTPAAEPRLYGHEIGVLGKEGIDFATEGLACYLDTRFRMNSGIELRDSCPANPGSMAALPRTTDCSSMPSCTSRARTGIPWEDLPARFG